MAANKYNKKALINYYGRLVFKGNYQKSEVPKEILNEVLLVADRLRKEEAAKAKS